jgi:hypothetical protein
VALGTATRTDGFITGNSSKKLIDIYPNPAQDFININFTGLEGNATVRVFDIYGKQVLQQQTNKTNSQLGISGLSKGIYMVKVLQGETVVSSKKIVKE